MSYKKAPRCTKDSEMPSLCHCILRPRFFTQPGTEEGFQGPGITPGRAWHAARDEDGSASPMLVPRTGWIRMN